MTLTDTQTVLLSHAAQRGSGSLYPLPATITAPACGVAKSVASLIRRGLAAEHETDDAMSVARSDGDLRYGMFITVAGKAAIGVEDGAAGTDMPAAAAEPAPAAPRATKSATVIALLQHDGGATLAELIAATGWLPHTTRAALTGLRKKGHAIERSKRGADTCYRIVAA